MTPKAKRDDALKHFFLPGPTAVRPEVLQAMTGPMIGHRDQAAEDLMAHIQPRLREVFRTERPVYVFPASGTGAMEAGLRNGARRRVLSLVNGAFSERFFEIARATGLQADPLEVPWGQAHTPEMLDKALKRGIYDTVTVCHSETSTGVLNPIREMAEVARANGDVALLIDSVSGLGGAPVETDAWGLDWILTGAQKALALPPGLAFGVAQERLLERAASKADRGFYFDFLTYEKNLQKNQTPFTPAVSLMYALSAQLDVMEEEGMERRWERHAAMARTTWAWARDLAERGVGVAIVAPERYRSPTVSAVRPPEGWTGPQVVAAAAERGYALATGYGKLKDETFRIGHMGEHTVADVEGLLEVLTELFTS